MQRLVPNFILEQSREGEQTGRFQAVTLFVDTSGFTPLTETLMDRGKDGAELLGSTLVALFTPLLDTVYAHNGFIAGFAGDAFKAVFPLDDHDDEQIYLQALAAAQKIQTHLLEHAGFETAFGKFEFAVKVVLADGEVTWSIWQAESMSSAEQKRAYSFAGAAIMSSLAGEALASAGDLLLSDSVAKRLATIMKSPLLLSKMQAEPFFRLEQPHIVENMPQTSPSEPVAPDIVDSEGFYSRDLLTMRTQGEFRHVLTCFINISEQPLPGEADDYMPTLLRLLHQFGGYLCRVGQIESAFAGGTYLLFWGAPNSYENDVARALRFILALQSEVTVPLRAGLTYGLSYAGFTGSPRRAEYTCYGTTVNIAARQMVAAAWDEIWLDEATTRRSSGLFDIVSKEGVRFKGVSETQTIYLLRQQGDSKQLRGEGELVGRQNELQLLQQAIAPILKGQFAGAVVIQGEAGMGKSYLVQACQYSDWLSNQPISWFYCQTDEILRQPLNPIRYFLRQYFGISRSNDEAVNKAAFAEKMARLQDQTTDEPLRHELERTASMLGALVGLRWEGSLYEQISPELRLENSLDAVKALFKAESQNRPVILQFEDVHWLDDGTIQLLKHLTHNVANFPIVILMTSRETVPDHWFDAETPLAIISLYGVHGDDIPSLAEQLVGEPVSNELAQFLYQKGEGNPFFIEQILLFLQEQGLLLATDSGLTPIIDQDIIPEDVRAILIARIDQLTMAVRNVVQTASVLGREFDVQVLSTMLQRDQELPTKMAAAEAERIWSPLSALQYIFQHALLRDSAYDMQLGSRLKALHKMAGEAIERIYGPDLAEFSTDLSYHFEQAAERQKSIVYLNLAADTAQKAYHNEQALAFLEKLLGYTTEVGDRVEIHIKQAQIVRHTGRMDEAQQFVEIGLQLARQNDLQDAILELLMLRGRIYDDRGQFDEANQHYDQALALAQERQNVPLISRAYLALADIEHERRNLSSALAYYEQAMPHVTANGDRQLLASLYNNMGNVYRTNGDYDRAETLYQQALDIRRELGSLKEVAYTLANTGIMHALQHQYDKSFPYMHEAAVIIEEIGDKRGLGRMNHNLGKMNVDSGNHEIAIPHFKRALTIYEEMGNQLAYARTTNTLGRAYRLIGELDLAQEHFERAIAMRREKDDRSGISLSYHNLALIAGDKGDLAKAVEYAELSLELMTQQQFAQQMGGNMAYLSYAYARAGRGVSALEIALRHFEHIESFGRDIVPGVTHLAVALALTQSEALPGESGVMLQTLASYTGLSSTAQSYFEAALQLAIDNNRSHANPMILREWGAWQLALGQKGEGVAHLAEAKQLAAEGRLQLELNKIREICMKHDLDYGTL
eukprot:jgi/Undpi1/12114/HiC_scaffold_41.g14087.m1